MFFRDGIFDCNDLDETPGMKVSLRLKTVNYEMIFRYLINGKFEDIKDSTELKFSEITDDFWYFNIYIYAAAHGWTEAVDAARSKIISSGISSGLKGLDSVAKSAAEINDTEMLKFWAKASGFPEEAFLE